MFKEFYMRVIMDKILANTLAYKGALIVMAFLYVLPFTNSFASEFLKVFLLWGGAIFLYDIFKKHVLFQKKIFWVVFLFLFITGISALLNFRQNFMRNAVFTLYGVVAILVPLLLDQKQKEGQVLKELYILNFIIIGITLLVSLASLFIFITDIQFSYTVEETEYIFGTFENRLFGILGNPNSGSLFAFISIFVSAINYAGFRKSGTLRMPLRIFLIGNILVQFIVLFLGNSRSAIVCLSIALAAVLLFACKNLFMQKSTKPLLFSLLTVLSIGVGFGASFSAWKGSNYLMGYLPSFYQYIDHRFNNDNPLDTEKLFAPNDTQREYLNDDVSNGRITIWTAGLMVAKDHLLYGVGDANILEYATPYLPEDLKERAPGLVANMHNVYLQILVGSGAVALLLFLIFALWLFLKGAKRLYFGSLKDKNYSIILLLFGLILGILAENLFDSNLIGFMCFFVVPVFWTYCGFFIRLVWQDPESLDELEESPKEHHPILEGQVES